MGFLRKNGNADIPIKLRFFDVVALCWGVVVIPTNYWRGRGKAGKVSVDVAAKARLDREIDRTLPLFVVFSAGADMEWM